MMKSKEFAKYLERDIWCYHCGITDETLVPQHRIRRGMGGKNKRAEQPANVIVLCSYINGLIESNAIAASNALRYGWTLESYENPELRPVFDRMLGQWWILDNNFRRRLSL
jgi:hypothetical protein